MELTQDSACFPDGELSDFQKARVGTYFIIPLRTTKKTLSEFDLNECTGELERAGWSPYKWAFDDLYGHINSIFNYIPETGRSKAANATSAIGIHYQISADKVMGGLAGGSQEIGEEQEYYVLTEDSRCQSDKNLYFRFRCMQIVMMHTGIGFLIIGIEGRSPLTPDLLLHAGYNQNSSLLGFVGISGRTLGFVDLIERLLQGIGMTDYAGCLERKQPESILRDTTTYSVAVLPKPTAQRSSGELKKLLKQLCLNLRHARAFGSDNYEDEDEDSFFNCAALNSFSSEKFIRWGIYTMFERTAQVIFQKDGSLADPINLNRNNREDNYLPFLLIVLYERYSYLFFSEMLRYEERVTRKNGDWMEEQMLRLKAFGVILPTDMTPYNNENVFLAEQRQIYSIDECIRLIDDKIGIIKHIQADRADRKRQLIEKILAVFGVISILCDSLGLLEVLVTDTVTPYLYRVTFGSELLLIAVAAVISLILYKRK